MTTNRMTATKVRKKKATAIGMIRCFTLAVAVITIIKTTCFSIDICIFY